MNCGPLLLERSTKHGSGLPCAERAVKWSLTRSEIEAKAPVAVCGRPFPSQARTGHCFTDFWAAYQVVILEEQHSAVGKEPGETAHVERWNKTLRQRLARFVRKTLSFSRIPVHA